MKESDKLRIKICYADKFEKLLDRLFLTDRQKEIARLKYSRGWYSADIAAELDIDRRTVTEEMQVIRKVIGSVDLDNLDD